MQTLQAADPDLARLLRTVEGIVPGLRGAQGGPAVAGALDADDAASLRRLCGHWARAHPEAGAHHLAVRCWGLAIWQPVYLSVVAAHRDTHVPRLAGLVQPVADGLPQGLRLPVHAPIGGRCVRQRMAVAAAELRGFCAAMRAALQPWVALHARAADRLQAECVLGALLAMRGAQPVEDDAAIVAWGAAWLDRLDLAGGCGFLRWRNEAGEAALALDRRLCCHAFRRHDGQHCSTCPKLPLETRLRLLRGD